MGLRWVFGVYWYLEVVESVWVVEDSEFEWLWVVVWVFGFFLLLLWNECLLVYGSGLVGFIVFFCCGKYVDVEVFEGIEVCFVFVNNVVSYCVGNV